MYPRSPKNFNQFHSMTRHFLVTGHFETSAPNYPVSPNDLEHLRVDHTCGYCPRSPKFQLICFALLFRVMGHFEKSVLHVNDSKMTLNTQKSKAPHLCSTSTPGSPKFHYFHSMNSQV